MTSKVNNLVNVPSGQKSKIECQCNTTLGGFTVFSGCKWKLLESNCSSLYFSLASDSAEFDDSFGDLAYTGDNLEETTSVPTTVSETTSEQNTTEVGTTSVPLTTTEAKGSTCYHKPFSTKIV